MSAASRRTDRRAFLANLAKTGAAAALADSAQGFAAEAPLIIGLIYGGPKNDLGYNQAHYEGAHTLLALPFVKVVDQANVTETNAAEEAMRDMIHLDGASVIFATSYGHLDPYVYRVARESPGVQFFHCGGYFREGVDPANIGVYFGYIDEVEYLAGMTAGLTTRTNRLGFVAPPGTAQHQQLYAGSPQRKPICLHESRLHRRLGLASPRGRSRQ